MKTIWVIILWDNNKSDRLVVPKRKNKILPCVKKSVRKMQNNKKKKRPNGRGVNAADVKQFIGVIK